ncbi:MAG: hypothetical protein HZA61_00585 [Candidatus Eisenbacteria bacterium]|uniref:Outer membrane protein beta-barrel domain-containing protein n=1 Tax=Eiseniibacteriota bacterium TaxID=2212470 RepID=A0A933SB32_UNCEI|nr:hypothetical protein [Candidatus Eisenbacteria bacterium]
MRLAVATCFALFLTVLPAAAPAQPAGRPPDDPGAPRDTSGVLPTWMDGAVEAGVGWMADPQRVKDRYSAGMDVALVLQAKVAPALRFGVRVEYHDLPSNNEGFAVTSGGLVSLRDFGDGKVYDAVATASARVWSQLWLEAMAGYGYFDAGFGDVSFVDGLTGENFVPPGRTGGGPVVGAGVRYEFQPTRRDRLYVGTGWRRMVLEDATIQLVPIQIAYRFR